MNKNEVDYVYRLSQELAQLRADLEKAEHLHFEVTGKSLRALLKRDAASTESTKDATPPLAIGAAAFATESIPSCLEPTLLLQIQTLNQSKASALKSNPTNYRLGQYPLTDEQQNGVDLAATGESLKVEAGAGSGKTSSLTAISHNLGKKKGLYLAFNQSVIRDAKGRFHPNTDCRTTHSVAFGFVGKLYADRIQKKNLSSKIIVAALGLEDWNNISKWGQANVIRQWVINFTQSDLQVLSNKVAPWRAIKMLSKQGDRQMAYEESKPIAAYLGPLASMLWEMLQDVHGTLPIWPDVYLKVWALTNPQLHTNYILLDEAQDTAKVILKLIQDQESQVIWVGDRRQQIYAWRGAVNAMETIVTPHTCQLTRSFRYGQPIADLANKVLENFLGEPKFRIVGSPMVESKLCEVENPKMILCRGNRGAMKELMEALRLKKRVHMAGDISTMIAEVESCVSIMNGRRPRLPDFQMFNTWNEVLEYSETEAGAELQTLVKLLKLWPATELLQALSAVQEVKQEDADVTISTAHKAKGLESPSVRLADDFSFPPSDLGRPDMPYSEEEARILYVALTRAQHELDISQCRAAHVALQWSGPPASINANTK